MEKDDVLSLGPPEAAGPSQPRISLLDLAEAAATLSKKQPARAQPKRQPAKAKPEDNLLAVKKGPRSIRKRKVSNSPDETAKPVPAIPNGMQTRGRSRRQSLDLQANNPSGSPGSIRPPSTAAKHKTATDALQSESLEQVKSSMMAQNGILTEAAMAAPSGKPCSHADKLPEEQPAGPSHVHSQSDADPATTDHHPAQTLSTMKSPTAMHAKPAGADSDPGSSRHEPPTAQQRTSASKHDGQHKEPAAAATVSLQHGAAVTHQQLASEAGAAGAAPDKSVVKAKKRKHKQKPEGRQPAASAPQPAADAGVSAAAASDAAEPIVKPKKHKSKHKDGTQLLLTAPVDVPA